MSTRQMVSFVLVLSCLFCPAVAGAQTNTVTLAGVATDDTGGALPGVTVTATNTATGLVRTAITDSAGRYTVLGLPPALYDVRAELQGFAPVVQRAQQLQVGQTVTLDFKLKLGALSETVEVTAEVSVVQTESNVLTRVVRTEEVDRLPSLTRDFTQLANLTPGVTVSANNVTIGNGPANSTGFQVDGTSMQAPTMGGTAIQLVQDWIQEFSVLSSQFPVEFGAAQSGVVNAVTRSGSNRTQGRAFGYFQDEALNATLWRATTKNPFGQQRSGAQVGGPILRDRLLYFVGYERNHSLTNIPVSISPIFVGNVPDVTLNAAGTQAVGTVEQDTTVHSIIAKVDYRPGSAHTVTPRVIVRKFNQSANGSATATNVPLTASRGPQYQLNDSSQVAWTWVMSSSSLLDTRVEFRRNHLQNGCFAAPSLFGWPTSLTAINVPTFVYPSGGPTIGCNGRWGDAFEEGWFVNEAFTTNRGPHTLKFGGVFVRPVNHVVETQNQSGRYTMPSVELFSEANPLTYPLAYALSFEPGEHPGWALGGSQFGLFAQDTWRLGQELTLSLGIRYDAEAKVSTINEDVDSMKPPYNTHLNHVNPNLGNVAPRARIHVGAWRYQAGGDSRRLRDVLRHGQERHVRGVGRAGGQSALPGRRAHEHRLEQRDAESLLSRQHPVRRRGAGGSPECPATGDGVRDYQQHRAKPGGHLCHRERGDNRVARRGGQSHPLERRAHRGEPQDAVHTSGDDRRTVRSRQGFFRVSRPEVHPGAGPVHSSERQPDDRRPDHRSGVSVAEQAGQWWCAGRQAAVGGGRLPIGEANKMQVAYALGSASNNSIGNLANGIGQIPATNPFDYSVDQGPASSDQLHILNVSGNLSLPWGISLAPLFRATSGIRVNPVTNGRPSPAQGCQVYYSQCYPFNLTDGQVVGRNSFIGEPNWTVSARLSKEVRIGTRSLTGMIEAFNLTNRVNYTGYNGNIGGTTGLVTDLSGIVPNAADLMRQVQIGFRFDF